MAGMSQKIAERAVLLGPRRSLVGILARPAAPGASSPPAIVILNTGIIHRVGPHRLFVLLSRALARTGLTVLRFDFSGIGDSDPRPDGRAPLESCLADISDALDWLEQETSPPRIILVGLCSGADHAVLYGHTDPRVAGLVLVDPSIPATALFYMQYIGQRMARLRNWISVIRGRSNIVRLWVGHTFAAVWPGGRTRPMTLQNMRMHADLERIYQRSVASGLQMLAVFTAESTRQTYREQMIDAFPNVAFGDQLTLEHIPGSDHLFSTDAHRRQLVDMVIGWLEQRGLVTVPAPHRAAVVE
jgi:pimeloyl-ACP methyl ester carboxylesterase